MVKRRSFLKGIGASALFGEFGTAAASDDATPHPHGTGGPGNDDELPVYAQGVLTVEYQRNIRDGNYIIEKKFESRDLEERYGDPVFTYEPRHVDEEGVPEEVKEGRKRKYKIRTHRVIGTPDEHFVSETEIWERNVEELRTHSRLPDLEDKVPLYHYKSEDKAETEWRWDRGAPINVAWEDMDSSDIRDDMQDGRGGAEEWSRSRRASLLGDEYTVDQYINDDGTVKSTDEHVIEHIPDWYCPSGTKQWHVRLYDVDASGVAAIGQAHRDPCDHTKVPIAYSDKFYLDNARKAVTRWWLYAASDISIGAERIDVDNTHDEFSTHSGEISFIGTSASRPHSGTPGLSRYQP